MMTKDGLFITVEGPDGAGKSTVIRALESHLKATFNQDVILTREPGGSPIAEKIRALLLDPRHTQMDVKTEALLMAASRRQHIVDTIIPALSAGNIVLSDRFVDSSLAYQGAGRQLGMKAVWEMNLFAMEDLQPDITLLLDVDVQTGLSRINDEQSNRSADRLEQEDISFHNRVRQGYKELLKQFPNRFIHVDASQEQDKVIAESWKLLKKQLDRLV